MPGGVKDDPKLFLSVADDGTVNLLCIRAEMGQGIRTSFGTVVADELGSRPRSRQGAAGAGRPGALRQPGHRRLAQHAPSFRAASPHRGGDPADARRGSSRPVGRSGHRGQGREPWHRPWPRATGVSSSARSPRARRRGRCRRADSSVLKPREPVPLHRQGHVPLIDNLDITTGKAIFGIDARVDGMAYAVVARPPVLRRQGQELRRRQDDEGARACSRSITIDPPTPPIVFQPLGGVAVIAENTFAAIKGRSQLEIQWDDGPNASYDSVQYRKTLEEAAAKPGQVVRNNGDVDRRSGGSRQAPVGGILRPAPRPGADGAAVGHRPRHGRRLRGLVSACRTPKPSAPTCRNASTCRSTRSP